VGPIYFTACALHRHADLGAEFCPPFVGGIGTDEETPGSRQQLVCRWILLRKKKHRLMRAVETGWPGGAPHMEEKLSIYSLLNNIRAEKFRKNRR
jgi:hypothetical protein